MKILLAVDGSAPSLAAARAVAQRPWPAGSQVKIISAVRLPFVPTEETRSLPESDYSQLERAGREQAQTAIQQAQAILQQNGELEIESELALGDAKEIILEAAEDWPADLIVLGSRGLSGVKRFLLGSVALEVTLHAPCSVEVVR